MSAVSLRTSPRGRVGDRLFAWLSTTAGATLLAVMAAIAAFLVIEAVPALTVNTADFLTSREWFPDATPSRFGIAALAYGTVVSSLLALALALPVAVGVALFIAFYAPRRLAQALGYVVDLLAAVPSVIFGLWGLLFLVPHMIPLSRFLSDHLGWIPLFASDGTFGRSIFTAGVVLAIMILPIIAAISREVFLQVPTTHREAALALGATRWEMIRLSVLPFGRPGVISGAMLGLGRALGETIAVALVLSASFDISVRILQPGGNTFAANIANRFGEAGSVGRGALIASGLVLFVITLVVNMAARAIVARRREFSGAAG
jgi:phosphate transport system permease protein